MKLDEKLSNIDNEAAIPDYTKLYNGCFIIKYKKLGNKVFEKYIAVQDGNIYLVDKEDGNIISKFLIGTVN